MLHTMLRSPLFLVDIAAAAVISSSNKHKHRLTDEMPLLFEPPPTPPPSPTPHSSFDEKGHKNDTSSGERKLVDITIQASLTSSCFLLSVFSDSAVPTTASNVHAEIRRDIHSKKRKKKTKSAHQLFTIHFLMVDFFYQVMLTSSKLQAVLFALLGPILPKVHFIEKGFGKPPLVLTTYSSFFSLSYLSLLTACFTC